MPQKRYADQKPSGDPDTGLQELLRKDLPVSPATYIAQLEMHRRLHTRAGYLADLDELIKLARAERNKFKAT